MSNTVRTTISVPRALKARMDAYEPPINWSAVACRAFEAIIGIDGPPGSDADMTIIEPHPDGHGVRLLDHEDTTELRRNIDAGRIVAIYAGAVGDNVAFVLCTSAASLRQFFDAAIEADCTYTIEGWSREPLTLKPGQPHNDA
jgi:hypothetical protein